jgi:membrane fusion protein, copper/silver efflux system
MPSKLRSLGGRIVVILVLVAAVGAIVAGLAIWRPGRGMEHASNETWTCSMHPQVRRPKPGTCPICGMQLIPISKLPSARNDLETRAGLESEPVQRRELFKEIRTVGKLDYSERQVAYISSRVDGRVDRLFVDFTGVEVKQGDHLVEIYSPDLYSAQAELLLALGAAEKGGGDRRFAAAGLEAARTKLRLLGILPEQITELETDRQQLTHLTIYAPIGGTVIEKNVRVGQYLSTGDSVYRIADLDPIWLYLNIYEFDISWVRVGQTVDVQLEAFPGEIFAGSIMFIDPFLDDATRTIRVRVNIKNPDRLLKPQMFATATISVKLLPDGAPEPTGLEGMFVCPMHPEVMQREPGKCSICEMPLEKVPERRVRVEGLGVSGEKTDDQAEVPSEAPKSANSDQKFENDGPAKDVGHVQQPMDESEPTEKKDTSHKGVLAIPVSAVLDTGRRRITYRLTEGAYELVDLTIGPRAYALDEAGRRREFFVVLDGIKEGDQVVSQSGFLLDSQRQIEGMPSLLYPTGQSGTSLHSGHDAMGSGNGPTPSPSTKGTTSKHKH